MCVYSEPREWIEESIDSILNQTFKSFEFIIINDNPKRILNEKVLQVYKNKDSRITILKNEKNIGLTKSLNKGLEIAKGTYLARMDADDISMIDRFKIQYDFLESNSDYILCGTSRIDFNGNNEKIVILPSSDEEIKTEMLLRNRITHPSVMLRTKIIKKNKLKYNEKIKKSQDYNFWTLLSDYGKFFNIKIPLIKYRISENQISKKNFKEQYFYSAKNRSLYINKFFKNIDIEISKDEAFNEITSLNISRKNKEIYLSAYMIFNDKHKIKVYFMFLFRLNFFLFIKVHKFFLVDLINTYKLNVKK